MYSFGAVMAELLTCRMVVCFDMPESDRNLAMCFASVVQENHLLQILEDRIVNEGYIEQLKEVVNLAQRCLKVRGERGWLSWTNIHWETLMSIQKRMIIFSMHLLNHSALMLAQLLLVQLLGTKT